MEPIYSVVSSTSDISWHLTTLLYRIFQIIANFVFEDIMKLPKGRLIFLLLGPSNTSSKGVEEDQIWEIMSKGLGTYHITLVNMSTLEERDSGS